MLDFLREILNLLKGESNITPSIAIFFVCMAAMAVSSLALWVVLVTLKMG